MILPKKYEIYESTPEKFNKYEGVAKISYSQYTSFKDPQYRASYIIQYMIQCEYKSAFEIFATYGNQVGTYLESKGMDLPQPATQLLSPEDKEILEKLPIEEHSLFEYEIVMPVYDSAGKLLFCVQGFVDKAVLFEDKASVIDYKTGNTTTKVAYYAGDEYGQTTLYSHYLATQENYTIDYSGVTLLGRKGNGLPGKELKLSGEVLNIPTPYSKERGEEVIAGITKVALEIEKYYKVYLKLVD